MPINTMFNDLLKDIYTITQIHMHNSMGRYQHLSTVSRIFANKHN